MNIEAESDAREAEDEARDEAENRKLIQLIVAWKKARLDVIICRQLMPIDGYIVMGNRLRLLVGLELQAERELLEFELEITGH